MKLRKLPRRSDMDAEGRNTTREYLPGIDSAECEALLTLSDAGSSHSTPHKPEKDRLTHMKMEDSDNAEVQEKQQIDEALQGKHELMKSFSERTFLRNNSTT